MSGERVGFTGAEALELPGWSGMFLWRDRNPGRGDGTPVAMADYLAVRVILEYGQASTSMIQRRLRVGYSRASRLIDTMEQKGYVTRLVGSKPRDVIIKQAQYREIFGDDTPFAEIPASDHAPIGDFYRDK